MKPSLRNHLIQLDRTLVDLFNERARLFTEAGEQASELRASVDDLLARSAGPFPATELRTAFEALDRGSLGARR
jgi:hypothetical protein